MKHFPQSWKEYWIEEFMDQAIISLKPQYANLILSGEKTVELRNRTVRLKSGTTIWIYATQPVGRIVANAKIKTVSHGIPSEIWDRYGEKICIEKTHFDFYIGNSRQVSALVLSSVKRIQDPCTLENIRQVVEDFHPPQFYSHLPSDDLLFGTLNSLANHSVSRRRRSSG